MKRALIPILLVIGLVVGAAIGWAVADSRDDGGSGATATTGTTPAGEDGPGQVREGTRDLGEINASLPDGFTATIAADKIPYGTAFALDGKGGGYLGVLEGGRKAAVYHLSDPDGDGVMDKIAKFADVPSLVSGFLLRPDGVYVGVRGSILLLQDTNGDGTAEPPKPIISGLPVAEHIDIHSNDGMAVGPDGMLYFGLGATCNLCDEPDQRNATIMRCTIEGGGCEVYAHGLRNAWDLAFHPEDGSLWADDNSPDPIGGEPVGNQDEVNWVRQGLAYGYPFCWGNGKGYNCEGTEAPAVELERRAAPSGIAFSTSSAMPAEYRDNLFVTLWGGRRMIRVVTTKADGAWTAEASDFVSLDRPVDVVEDEDGSLLVLDSDAARIYRISPPA
ncbi:MAG: hypothetical protein QOD86_1236 [Miltoncostaeaceae bacterium]|nr:hypothetical protein [Miltoncostaeaceae bacterium]